MERRRRSVSEHIRRWYYLGRGEQPLAVVFWPQDWKRGTVREVDGTSYLITRYARSEFVDYFEVWGSRADATQPAAEEHTNVPVKMGGIDVDGRDRSR